MNRRELLLAAGFGGLVAACTRARPPAPSFATPSSTTGPVTTSRAASPSEAPVDTIVVVMLENRSFDHHFGLLPSVDGLAGKALTNPNAEGEPVKIHHLDDACTETDPDHSFEGSHEQWNMGRNDGFVKRSGAVAMGYREPLDVPFTTALAREFAVCDRWFCSVLGPTYPNRHYLHSATSDGRTSNELVPFDKPAIWDRLDEAGIPWGYYYGDLPFLGLYPRLFMPGVERKNIVTVDKFYEHAAAGRLPRVAFVEPVFLGPLASDDHPPHNSQLAQRFAAQVFGALASSPQWSRSLFVLTYDEHGGFFDHVPPPPVVDDFGSQGFDRLGFRVPAVLAGPHVRRNFVCSTVLDHTSVLRFIEWRFGLRPLGVRDANANNLLDALDFSRGDPSVPRLPVPELDPAHALLCAPPTSSTAGALGPERKTALTAGARPGAGDGMDLLAEVVPDELRGSGLGMPAALTHPSLITVHLA